MAQNERDYSCVSARWQNGENVQYIFYFNRKKGKEKQQPKKKRTRKAMNLEKLIALQGD